MPDVFPARSSKRMPRPRVALAALACVLLLGTTACSSADADEPGTSKASPSASAEPIFASDEEALAAAVAAYEAYTTTSAQVGADGGTGAERIEQVVGPALATEFLEEFALLDGAGLRTTGETRIFGAKLAEWSEESGTASVSAYFCRDVSGARVVDANGNDVTSADRPDVSAVLAHFTSADRKPRSLILEAMESWDAASLCG